MVGLKWLKKESISIRSLIVHSNTILIFQTKKEKTHSVQMRQIINIFTTAIIKLSKALNNSKTVMLINPMRQKMPTVSYLSLILSQKYSSH
jgi:hypothetical protein